jgi:hypothetical protein
MAKDETGNPLVFDAADQYWTGNVEVDLSLGNPGTKNTGQRIFVEKIVVKAGDGGAVLVEETSGGRDILNFASTTASDTITWPVNKEYAGVYITTLPASARIEVYHGRNA